MLLSEAVTLFINLNFSENHLMKKLPVTHTYSFLNVSFFKGLLSTGGVWSDLEKSKTVSTESI